MVEHKSTRGGSRAPAPPTKPNTIIRETVNEIDRRLARATGLVEICEFAADANLIIAGEAIMETLPTALEILKTLPALTQVIVAADKRNDRSARLGKAKAAG